MGARIIRNDNPLIRRAVAEAARQAVVKACLDTEAEAKMQATAKDIVDTGALRASIYVDAPGRSNYEFSAARAKAEAAKGSIKHRKSGKAKPKQIEVFGRIRLEQKSGCATGLCGVGVTYGIYNEMGTVRMAARPFMLPAREKVTPNFVKDCEQILRTLTGL